MEQVVDKAGADYWTNVWKNTTLPPAINPKSDALNNHINKEFDKTFHEVFKNIETKGKLFIEIGCGNSVWLPYFSKEFGFAVSGLDYSEYGCETSRKILARENVVGEIVCGDMFNPPESLLNKFDFLISMGVVEHFSDTSQAIKALSKFLKKDGILITTIPNHAGLLGLLQKILNRPVYDIHVILDKEDLNAAIEKNNLKLLFSKYLVSTSLFVNLEAKDQPLSFYGFRKIISKGLAMITYTVWTFEKFLFKLPSIKLFSPAIISLAKKTEIGK